MDFKRLDTAFVTKLGATLPVAGEGYKVNVTGLGAVPMHFDYPEEWWAEYALPGINVRRIDLIPDPTRFFPGYVTYEKSTSEPNTMNRLKNVPVPVTVLYTVELAADSQSVMNQLILHNMQALPTQGYGTTISAFGHTIPFRSNSIRNKTDKKAKEGRKFVWEYTYAVDTYIFSTECEKVPQVLQVNLTIENTEDGTTNVVKVDQNGMI